ncbi:MAG: hypothetical protein GY737_15510 [Desulfobacteraceae bacterium]|nr:hypothetical protein [Desulfobacteraceae bacterium]
MKSLPQTKPEGLPALRTGEILVREGLINQEDIDRVLAVQKRGEESPLLDSSRRFGMILCDLNLITPLDNYWVLHKYNKLVTIEQTLVRDEKLPSNALAQASLKAKASGTSLFATLLSQGMITVVELQKLVYDHYRIPYRTLQEFRFNHAMAEDLSTIVEKRLALGYRMIPLVLREKVILVGIVEPDALLPLKKLSTRFPHLRFKAVFIPFSGFKNLFNQLYGESGEPVVQEQSPDLSLLLNFQVTITDPEIESNKIQSLYKRYEMVRTLAGGNHSIARSRAFHEFIKGEHGKLRDKYRVTGITYSLRKQGQEPIVVAVPKGLKQVTCQE